jgi:23S rRNA (adenine1618-N6)-methyltransferase
LQVLKKYHKIPKKVVTAKPKVPGLHPRNAHQGRYDLDTLCKALPELSTYIVKTDFGDSSINFFNPEAVKILNKAILFKDYNIIYWDIPNGYLCPPIPGRADYIHFLADILNELPEKDTLIHPNFNCLDIGTGANLIYPIIGHTAYKWKFIATDIDPIALSNANEILQKNAELSKVIELKLQENKNAFFKGIVNKDDYFEASICNPPFHSSQEEASAGTLRKLKNLKAEVVQEDALNFGGQNNELIYEGGELKFIQDLAKESTKYKRNILWFSSLVSKSAHIHILQRFLSELGVAEQKTIEMGQGNKTSRFIAWTFFSKSERLKLLEGKKTQNDPH